MAGWMSWRPSYCLKIGARDVAWADMRRDWTGRLRYRVHVAPLPEGVVQVSPLEPNVLKPEDLARRVRELSSISRPHKTPAAHVKRRLPRAVTLLIPDLAVRTAVLHLQELPLKHEEQEALIRWRLGQEQLCSLMGTRVYFQIFPASEQTLDAAHTVLAVVIQEAVLRQYEAVCEAADFVPLHVEVSSLALFNLWVQASGGVNRIMGDFLWVNVSDGGFTTFVFHRGHLVFQRTKRQGQAGNQGSGTIDAGHAWSEWLTEECLASLYACQQRYSSLAATHLVMVGPDEPYSGFHEQLGRALGVSVKGWSWDDLHYPRQRTTGTLSTPSLPAVAGL